MATMKDMIGQMLDKIADQAVQIARQETQKNRFEKQANEWEQRALRAEQKLADSVDWQVSSENNFAAYKAEKQKVCRLARKMEDALDLIESLAASDRMEVTLAYKERAEA